MVSPLFASPCGSPAAVKLLLLCFGICGVTVSVLKIMWKILTRFSVLGIPRLGERQLTLSSYTKDWFSGDAKWIRINRREAEFKPRGVDHRKIQNVLKRDCPANARCYIRIERLEKLWNESNVLCQKPLVTS